MKEKLYLKINLKNPELIPTRDGYGRGLVELGEKNPNIVVLTGDLMESTRVHWFAEKFPRRFFDIGVAEQNMTGIAAGLAYEGKIPFISSYAVFSPGRSWDQVRVTVAYGNLNVKIAGAHAGISVGPDGATHQGCEDIAIMRVLPNFVVLAPCDFWETKKATLWAAKHKGPVYFRFLREKTPVITTEKTPFEVGKALVFREGTDVTVIACGQMVYEALVAAENLQKEGISVRVINNHTIKPIDKKTIIQAAKETGAIVTAEEHQINGGLGSAVAEVLVENYPVPMERVGLLDTFGESGKPEELLVKYHMKAGDIEKAVRKVIKRKWLSVKRKVKS